MVDHLTCHNPLGFTSTELFKRAFDHEKAAAIGMAAGPNTSYTRTFLACAFALRIAAQQLKENEA